MLVTVLSNTTADSQGRKDAPIGLSLAMFAPPSEPEPMPPGAVEPPPRKESTPEEEPESEPEPEIEPEPEQRPAPPPPEKPKPQPRPKPEPKPKPPPVPKKAPPQPSRPKLLKPAPRKETPSPEKRSGARERVTARTEAPSALALPAATAREEQRYLAALRERIKHKKRYPRVSRRRGEEGKVIVSFVIRKNGKLTDLRITRSSGIPRLDNAALEIFRRINSFPPIPASLGRKRWALSVPISYHLRRSPR